MRLVQKSGLCCGGLGVEDALHITRKMTVVTFALASNGVRD